VRHNQSSRKSKFINRALLATAVLSAVGATTLSGALFFGYLPFPAETESVETALVPLINEPGASLQLEAPPAAPLDGQKADPFLMGVVGKEETQTPVAVAPQFDREEVLKDFDNRISDEFNIPKTLQDRVGFWFDVYTKYDDNRRIIHHQDFPWIIFKVVDVTEIINAPKPKARWMRNEKADKLVKQEVEKVRATIAKLARGASVKKLSSDELLVAKALSGINGNVQKAAKKSIGEVRVQTGQRSFFAEGLSVSPRYLKTMEKIFRDKKLPVELTRLPFVESSFNKHATSKVGATGIWQFMGNTGRKFMLVNDVIDERRSPFKASEAAARLLKENHMILGRSWPFALTAWNHGPGGVRKASKAAGSKDLGTIIARYRSKSFDFASSNFYCEFLGALYAEKYNDMIFGQIEREEELNPMVVKVSRPVRARDVLRVSGLDEETFLLLNADLKVAMKKNAALPLGFRLHIPDSSRVAIERMMGIREKQKIASR
jgi:membrane-bound lytic murein transglycosylase D